MAKDEKKVEVSERETLWAKFLENYKAANPVKFAQKEEAGAFKTIPSSFLGKVIIKNGKERIY